MFEIDLMQHSVPFAVNPAVVEPQVNVRHLVTDRSVSERGVTSGVRHGLSLVVLNLCSLFKYFVEQKHFQMIRLNASRKSFEKSAYTSGLTAELQYPSQKSTENKRSLTHPSQNPRYRYIVKKGNQQTMKPPTMIARVLAALVSMRNLRTWTLMLRFPRRRVVTGEKSLDRLGKSSLKRFGWFSRWFRSLPLLVHIDICTEEFVETVGLGKLSAEGYETDILIFSCWRRAPKRVFLSVDDDTDEDKLLPFLVDSFSVLRPRCILNVKFVSLQLLSWLPFLPFLPKIK